MRCMSVTVRRYGITRRILAHDKKRTGPLQIIPVTTKSGHVILSEAKNLGVASQILRFAQNDSSDFDWLAMIMFGQCVAISITHGPDIVGSDRRYSQKLDARRTGTGALHDAPLFAVPVLGERLEKQVAVGVVVATHGPDIVSG